MDNAIIIFLKNPELGKVKTRLAATVGNEKALEIYLELVAHTLEIVKYIEADKFIYFSDEIDTAIGFKDLPFYAAVQQGEDLGRRMENAIADIFANLYRRVIIIGTDCPGINAQGLQSAFNKLTEADVVIGPATDGGYYLLGMSQPQPILFRNIEWSTSTVLRATTAHCINNNISYAMLPELSDIDDERDLKHLERLLKRKRA
jgi:hypothetical protein